MLDMQVAHVTCVEHTEQEVGKAGAFRCKAGVFIGFHNGFEFGRGKHVFQRGYSTEKGINRPRQDKFRTCTFGAEVVFQPFFLSLMRAATWGMRLSLFEQVVYVCCIFMFQSTVSSIRRLTPQHDGDVSCRVSYLGKEGRIKRSSSALPFS